jgi:hypothetical protein
MSALPAPLARRTTFDLFNPYPLSSSSLLYPTTTSHPAMSVLPYPPLVEDAKFVVLSDWVRPARYSSTPHLHPTPFWGCSNLHFLFAGLSTLSGRY